MIRTINDKDYTFRITRKGICAAEKAGMNISEMADKPISAAYYLWYAALYAAQPMAFEKSQNLLEDYLDSENCPESFEDVLSCLGKEFSEVFA